jgi:type VI secretion system protein ImpH
MLSTQRRAVTPVIERLLADPHRHQFFQAVRLLSRWFSRQDSLDEEDVLVHRLRFRSSLSLSFPASEIEALKPLEAVTDNEDGEERQTLPARFELTPAFMGLLGVHGSLPLHYTENLIHREVFGRDAGARAFLDLFNHRSVSLFYLAWKKHRLPIGYEADRGQRFLPLVLSLAGLGPAALRDRLLGEEGGGLHDESVAHFAAALQRRQLSGPQLQAWLSAHFGVPVELESFVGRWVRLPATAHTTLGCNAGVLGRSAVVGERLWQRDLRVRLRLGPLSRWRFEHFLPGAPGARALQRLLTLACGASLEFEICLRLRREDVQPIQLGSDAGPQAARLGWTAFLSTRATDRDREDLVYDALASA